MAAYNGPPHTGSDPGSCSSGVHPGLDPQFPVFGRPVVYVHAPPHPPVFHYQWPMPFSGNPFPGLPGMSYGMVAPPALFPPPPHMEAPAYILPHVPPVDHRRWFHPHVTNQAAAFPIRRIQPPRPVPAKVTVNSEVQTESLQTDGGTHSEQCRPVGSDSGRETHSTSPFSSGSSSPKQPAETHNHGNCEVTEAAAGSSSGAAQEVQLAEDGGQELALIPMWKDRCHLWMSSPVVVCSSSKEGETTGYVPEPLKTPGQELHTDDPREAGRSAAGGGREDQLNDSLWSVETMPPYIPSTQWLIYNGLMKPGSRITGVEPDENLGDNPSDLCSEGGEECGPEVSQCSTNAEEMEEPLLTHPLEPGGSQPGHGRFVDCGVQCNELRECRCTKGQEV